MQRYTPGALPNQSANGSPRVSEEMRPLTGAERLCELIRSEHGRAGVARFLVVLAPFVPRSFLERLAERCGVDCPPAQDAPRHERPKETPAIKPEQLLKLMNMGGSGGLDTAALLQLIGEMNK